MKFLSGIVACTAVLASVISGVNGAAAKKKPDTKYFHEPGRTDLSGHYDIRFFKDIVDYDTRLDTLTHLAKSWLQMTNKEGIETWIAHGTLLGWWWNGALLPWDWDLDVQVMAPTLTMMGEKYNMTRWPYTSEDGKVHREYLLDVNAWVWQRTRGDGMNIIDARWIDTRNGLFIDITGIAETEPEKKPGMYNCKNYHWYKYSDIFPLRDVYFEGVPAKIPYAYDDILIKEYKTKSLVVTEYEGHRWNSKKKTWELASGIASGKAGEKQAMKKIDDPARFVPQSGGGFFTNVWRLVHWW